MSYFVWDIRKSQKYKVELGNHSIFLKLCTFRPNTTTRNYKNCIQNAFSFPSLNNQLSPSIIKYDWQVTAIARCHEFSRCLDTPLLSSWWTVTSTWSKATFVTQIRVPPSQIGMLSILKVQLPNNIWLQLRLPSSATMVRTWLDLEHWFIMVQFSSNHPGISRSLRRAPWT